jgi:hypothetical protein
MKKSLLQHLAGLAGLLFSVITFGQTGCPQASVLYVGTDPSGYGDSTVVEHVELDLGYSVDVAAPSEVVIDDVLSYDLIIISSTISSTDAGMFRDVEVPILSMENHGLDEELGMVQAKEEAGYTTYGIAPYVNENENSFDSLMVLAGDSVKAIGLDAGYGGQTVQVFTEDVPFGNNRHPGQWGVPNENAYLILQYTQATLDLIVTEDLTLCGENGGDFCANPRYAAFSYPKGAEMGFDNMPAPDKRSFFFFHDYSAAAASQEAWDIFDAMIFWSLGCLNRPEPTGIGDNRNRNENSALISIYPNPAAGPVTLELNINDGKSYQLDMFDVLGKMVFSYEIRNSGLFRKQIVIDKPGFYFLKLTDNQANIIEMKKFIKN